MNDELPAKAPSLLDRLIRFCLENKLIVLLLVGFFVTWGLVVAPFDWDLGQLPRDPVPVDAIPDIGENQQIVFTRWMGRSPQDVEDQITYPLTASLLGVPGVKTVRSLSMFGFSTIYVIFDEKIEFYWSRSRVLEKLNSLPANALPPGVQPMLGPDATALGQVFWYTLEGRDEQGNTTGGWDLQELRSIQDWNVRYHLMAARDESGTGLISEVASIGGFVKEYQIDVDPDAMRAHGVTLAQVVNAIRRSNVDVGARTIEVNRVEYVIRGLGFIRSLEDIENAVVKVNDNVPLTVKNIAHVTTGPALRRGALDKGGAEVVGGVVVVRYGENPLAAIKGVKNKIEEISASLPSKVLPDGTVSRVTIVPFYDRTGLIYETLGTLKTALTEEILVTIIVVLVMVMHMRSSVLISGLLPLSVLMCFIAMKVFGIDANVVALSGIAIAIGTMVDMGIVICENILRHLGEARPDANRLEVVYRAASEVGSAVLTAVATTIVGFLPVFMLQGAYGKLFRPLAFTKTFALLASVIVALTLIPPVAHMLFTTRLRKEFVRRLFYAGMAVAGILAAFLLAWWAGAVIILLAAYHFCEHWLPERVKRWAPWISTAIAVFIVAVLLSDHWLPLGPEKGLLRNFIFVGFLIGGLLGFFLLFQRAYPRILCWCLSHKIIFLCAPVFLLFLGLLIPLGFDTLFGWLPDSIRGLRPVSAVAHAFPPLGWEPRPSLDEGSFLYMPSTMPHASIGEVLDVLQKQDMAIRQIPEIEMVVGKLGRAETPLDPAPISMIETVINYSSEYLVDRDGKRRTFRFDNTGSDHFRNEAGDTVPAADGKPYVVHGKFVRNDANELIEDPHGKPFRLWRPPLDPDLNPDREAWPGIQTPQDIWDEILKAADVPGTTSAPKLQPIETRLVMLQSGMRAPMGIKVKGPNLEAIEEAGLQIEKYLKQVPSVEASSVIADRIVGKPYLEIDPDSEACKRYNLNTQDVMDVIELAIGGDPITTAYEDRERYPVRVRYLRELRDNIEEIGNILVAAPNGAQIPLKQLASINYVRGPQVIKTEDQFLLGYVLFDKKPGFAASEVVEQARAYLKTKVKEAPLPYGVTYSFAGSYEDSLRLFRTLIFLSIPLALFIIFMILYMQFKSVTTTFIVFSGIAVACSGGFVMIWLYAQTWLPDIHIFGTSMLELFQVHPFNITAAVAVGFLALFGIASDDGVVMATYLRDSFARREPATIEEIREATVAAGTRRIRACLMTTATTILALIPILTSTGRGSDIMVPMAIPSFGGMVFEIITMLWVPVVFCLVKEIRRKPAPEPSESGDTQ